MSEIKKSALLEENKRLREENKRLKEENQRMKNFLYNAAGAVLTVSLEILLEVVVNKIRSYERKRV